MGFLGLKRFGALGAGWLSTMVLNDSFDYLLYPIVIGLLGPVTGGLLMTAAAVGLNYFLVLIYNKTKEDWLGFEWLRLQEDKGVGLLGKFLRLGRWPAFFLLSWEDPFKAFVFIRGRLPAGFRFSKVDWEWFLGANLIGNLIWILMVSGVIEAFRRLVF